MSDQSDGPPAADPHGRSPAELAALRRRQVVIGCVLGGIVAVGVVVAIVLSIALGGTSDDPTSPEDAAKQWTTAVLKHDTGREHHLECVGNHDNAGVLQLVTLSSADISVGTAEPTADHHWSVPVSVGGTSLTVGVEEQNSRYLVC